MCLQIAFYSPRHQCSGSTVCKSHCRTVFITPHAMTATTWIHHIFLICEHHIRSFKCVCLHSLYQVIRFIIHDRSGPAFHKRKCIIINNIKPIQQFELNHLRPKRFYMNIKCIATSFCNAIAVGKAMYHFTLPRFRLPCKVKEVVVANAV